MRTRLRALLRPELVDDLPPATFREAIAMWLLGTLWVVASAGLAHVHPPSALPILLGGGLVAMWGWRRPDWLAWFPVAVVLALALDAVAPPAPPVPGWPVHRPELLAVAVVVVSLARAVALGRRPIARTPLDLPIALGVAVTAAAALAPAARPEALAALRDVLVAAVVFHAAVAIASRPGGAGGIALALALLAALGGIHAVALAWEGPSALPDAVRAIESRWSAPGSVAVLLAVAWPASLALAMGPGGRGLPLAAALFGGWGLALHLGAGTALASARPFAHMADPVRAIVTVLVLHALARVGARCLARDRRLRFADPARAALALACAVLALTELATGAVARFPLAVAGALVAGAAIGMARADARREAEGADTAAAGAGTAAAAREAA